MVNIVRDNRNYKAIHYRRKILPLISFGILVVILGQQVFFSHSVQATHIDQELSGRLRQRELAQQRSEVEKRKKSKKSKRKSSSSSKSAKSERKMHAAPQAQETVQQPAQQDSQAQAAQDARQEQAEVQQPQPVQQQVVQEQAEPQQPQYQQQQQLQQQMAQQQSAMQQQSVEQPNIAEAPTETAPEEEQKFGPKTQTRFTPSMERQHRSPLQLPDISMTGEEVHVETVDDISKASQSDMSAYSQVIALDDEAQAKLLEAMEPKPVNAEEDTGGMAQFMLDVSQQSQGLPGDKQEVVVEPTLEENTEPETGADFAAELAQKYEAQQKEREAGRGVAEKIAQSWYQNTDSTPSSNDQRYQSGNSQQSQQQLLQEQNDQRESNPANLENVEIDY